MFKLLHLSDPHFGKSSSAQAADIIAKANELEPDLTLISGDFSMRARKSEMLAARDWLRQLPQPQLTVPGNHDVPLLNQLFDRFFRPFRRYKKYICENLEPELDISKDNFTGRIVCFNSSTPFGLHLDWSRGFISPMQGSRIEDGFGDVEADSLRIVVFHHPLYRADDSSRVLVSPVELVKASLAEGGADLLLAGHFHQSYAGVLDLKHETRNMVVSQAPTACSTRLKGEPAGFHCLHLDSNIIRIQRYQWDETEFKIKDTTEFLKPGNNGQWVKVEV